MLAIRMQRTGRKGLANFRVIVQDFRFSPNSGRVVAQLGHYNPHTKETVLDKEKAEQFLANGAQPSDRVVKLLQDEKVKLPSWVEIPANDKKRAIRNPEKLRKNQPDEQEAKNEAPAPAEESAEEVAKDQEMAEEIAEVVKEEATIEAVEEIKEQVEVAAEKEAEKIVEAAEEKKEEPAEEKQEDKAETDKESEEKSAE